MTLSEHRFDDRDAMIEALRQTIAGELDNALAQNAQATLLLSGGSSPAPLYRGLSETPLDWQRVDVALVDERWVDPGDAASNERLLRATLLQNHAAAARFTGMKNNHPSPFSGESECNRAYARLQTPFDLALLGMGPDGHTASLFPGASGLTEALDRQLHCAAIRARRSEVTGEFLERMTLTPWSLLQSRRLLLMITGDEKWRVYQQARQNGADIDLPVSLLLDQDRVPVAVYWAP
ncbi:MAG: 6-phosphogluconolactonase [Gammaproteobacteria bacterium]|nr:6-phosphogluconolactonase [Gammaproteobacteria bacterium]